MLVLTRVEGDSILISLEFVKDVVLLTEAKLKDQISTTKITEEVVSEIGKNVEIKFLGQHKGRAKLGFEAHPIIKILRKEVNDSTRLEMTP